MPQLFTPRINRLPRYIFTGGLILVLLAAAGIYYAATPQTWRKGYAPEQSIPFSHALHVTELGMDCTACHSYSGYSKKAGLPDAQSCLSCHKHILPESAKLAALHIAGDPSSAHYTGQPLVWKRVNSLPDHAVFVHSAHVNRGISCTTCHGDIQNAERVAVTESLSMSWCLDCHRNPSPYLQPLETVTGTPPQSEEFVRRHPVKNPDGTIIDDHLKLQEVLAAQWKVNPPTDCSACHH